MRKSLRASLNVDVLFASTQKGLSRIQVFRLLKSGVSFAAGFTPFGVSASVEAFELAVSTRSRLLVEGCRLLG